MYYRWFKVNLTTEYARVRLTEDVVRFEVLYWYLICLVLSEYGLNYSIIFHTSNSFIFVELSL